MEIRRILHNNLSTVIKKVRNIFAEGNVICDIKDTMTCCWSMTCCMFSVLFCMTRQIHRLWRTVARNRLWRLCKLCLKHSATLEGQTVPIAGPVLIPPPPPALLATWTASCQTRGRSSVTILILFTLMPKMNHYLFPGGVVSCLLIFFVTEVHLCC